jgi:hypothetical protein
MYSAQVFADTDVLQAISEAAAKSPRLMDTALKRQLGRFKRDVLDVLRTEPSDSPDLPFVWSNDAAANARARRWYFANKVPRGSRGGRYQRTGALLNAWDVQLDASDGDGLLLATNDADGFDFVIGNRQVPSHADTGWYNADDELLKASERATDILIELWFTVADPFAGAGL